MCDAGIPAAKGEPCVMTTNPTITFRPTPVVAKILRQQAISERRTINAIMNHLVEEYLDSIGALPAKYKRFTTVKSYTG